MNPKYDDLLKSKMDDAAYAKLTALDNQKLYDFVGQFVEHCEPEKVYLFDDSEEDYAFIRNMVLEKGEEKKLAKEGQTIHWDGYGDQARDKANTKFLIKKEKLEEMKSLNSVEYEEGLSEVMGIAKGIMKGKEAIVKLFVEAPANSAFTRACAQITDSWYVTHSECILYRGGYEHFKKMSEKDDFYRFIHSAGQLDDRGCTVNLDKRRIYMDMEGRIIYSMNDQYAGNSVGLKKHAMRLAIYEAGQQKDWLCEHMFIMNCVNNEKNRKTVFAGAYPSACGKTSTAMIPGEEIIGDDIAYFRIIDGEFRAANVEQGMFGIIKDVNEKDDPVIFENLQKPQELIFSNVLAGPDNNPYWLGMGVDTPKEGSNHSGEGWTEGKKDAKGNVITLSHANARYTMPLAYLDNCSVEQLHDPAGVVVSGILYGGRDSDTTVPVEESPSWEDGIVIKACTIESETTAATLGAQGVRKPSPMANLDFVSYPLGQYVINNIEFGKKAKETPKIFSTNYFLRTKDGDFCTSKLAKKVWLHWAEGRVHGEFEALDTPTGKIPLYADLAALFKSLLGEDYAEEDYTYQFTFRTTKWIEKLQRSIEWFKSMDANMPASVIKVWEDKIAELENVKSKYGDEIKPGDYKG